MQRRTAENTFISLAKKVVFRKLKITAFEMTQICVTSILLYLLLLISRKFSTESSHILCFQQQNGAATKLSFCNSPFLEK